MSAVADAPMTDLGTARPASKETHHKRSRLVFLMKVVLPAVSALIVGLVVLIPQIKSYEERISMTFAKIKLEDLESLAMLNARYFGTDRKNQPFTVTANYAQEEKPGSAVYSLDAPKADLQRPDGTWLVLGSEIGLYAKDRQMLELLGGVTLFHDRGYEIQTSTATLNLKEGSALGDDPVKGHGPFGQIDSQGFRLYEKGERIHFTGRAKLVLRPGAEKKNLR